MNKIAIMARRKMARVAALLLGLALAPAALAEDFSVDVEVKLINLPADAKPKVSCVLLDANKKIVARGNAAVPDGPNFDERLTIAFDAGDGVTAPETAGDKESADDFYCYLTLREPTDDLKKQFGLQEAGGAVAVKSWSDCEASLREAKTEASPAAYPLICGEREETVRGFVRGSLE